MPGIVCNNSGHASCVARQSATIVPDNRLALPPSMAVEYFKGIAPSSRLAGVALRHPRCCILYFDRSPKVGQDAGILAGLGEPIGIAVSADVERVLNTPADLVLVAIYDDLQRMMPIFRTCLACGLNVISVGAHHSYPWHVTPTLAVELDALAKQRGVTITGTGNQDFFMVNLGTLLSGVCQRTERIVHRPLTDVNSFGRRSPKSLLVAKVRATSTSAQDMPRLSSCRN